MSQEKNTRKNTIKASDLQFTKEQVLHDYHIANLSRQLSMIGRREVLGGKAKFGIFGDGKEIVQLAMARVFQKGDFRSGYYRDQTLMLALGEIDLRQFFAQLYAHADPEAEPATGGRAMNAHYATRLINADGSWLRALREVMRARRPRSNTRKSAAVCASRTRVIFGVRVSMGVTRSLSARRYCKNLS